MLNIIKKFLDLVNFQPDEILLVTENEIYTYKDFLSYVNYIARQLLLNGFKKGDRVALLINGFAGFYCSLFAIWLSGGTVVPLNTSLHVRDIEVLINKAEASFIILAEEYFDMYNNNNTKKIVITKGKEETIPYSPLKDGDLAAIMFTSGTTGIPKGVCQTLASHSTNAYLTANALGVTQKDRVFINTPPYFTSGLSHFLTILCKGGSLCGNYGFYFGPQLLKVIEDNKCSGFGGAPTHLVRVIETLSSPWQGTSLRFIMSSGDYLPDNIIEKARLMLPGIKIFNVYGLTEFSGRVCILPPEEYKNKKGSVGKPIGDTKITILDDDGNKVSAGVQGEVHVAGDMLMKGYLNDPETTSRVKTSFGFKTGDFGYKDEDEYLWIQGRKDDIFKSSGEKVSTNFIKQELLALELFKDVAVIPAEDILMGKVPLAFVVMQEGVVFNKKDIKKKLLSRLPQNHIPIRYIILEEIPRTGSGKAIRSKLEAIIRD